MIGKLLLIGESGLLPFYLKQDETEIDNDLLSGFCRALHGISIELKFPLKNIGFEKHRMIVEDCTHTSNKTFLLAALYDEYHIEEGVKNKIRYVFDRFFKNDDSLKEGVRMNDKELRAEVLKAINDEMLKDFIWKNVTTIKSQLDPVLHEKANNIYAYCLTSSNNNILYFNTAEGAFNNHASQSAFDILQQFLYPLKMDTIPQGDKFIGIDLPMGLDIEDYVQTGEKTFGIVINTSINLKEEPNNELLLYFFGKNTLMRSCVPDIEERLRSTISNQ